MVSSQTTYAAVYSNGYKKAKVSYTVDFTNRDGNGKIAAYPTINGTSISGSGSTIVNLTNLDSFRGVVILVDHGVLIFYRDLQLNYIINLK